MYTYEVVVAEKNSTTKTLKRKYDTTMSPVIKDLLRVAHKIVTFMCKTHVYLNPFLQTHISMKLWRKTPTRNTLKSITIEHDYNTPYKELLTKCQMLTFEQTFT
jgi:hypothetical protein